MLMLLQVRGLDEEPHPVAVGGLGPKPLSVSAPSSTRGAGPGGTASRLEAIKARLQAERTGSTGSRCGNVVLQGHSSRLVCLSSFDFEHSPMCGMQASIEHITGPISSLPSWCSSHQHLWTYLITIGMQKATGMHRMPLRRSVCLWETMSVRHADQGGAHKVENAQDASAVEVATSPIRFGPASKAAASSIATAPAWVPSNMQGSAQPDGSREQGLQASDMSTSGGHQPFSISQPQSHRQAEGSPGRLMPRQQSSPGEHVYLVGVALPSELVVQLLQVSQTKRTHGLAGRTEPLQAKRSESAQLLDAASTRNDSHTRIMELQVCSLMAYPQVESALLGKLLA